MVTICEPCHIKQEERVYELLVGKGTANVRRDPLQRVRDEGVPTGGSGAEQRGTPSSPSRHALLPSASLLAYNYLLHPCLTGV